MTRSNDITKTIDKRVGAKIKELRIANGLSRQQLADTIDVTHQQLSKYEDATNRASISRMVLIAKTLKQPISYFTGEDGFEVIGSKQRLTIEVARKFSKIKSVANREAIAHLITTMSNEEKE